MAKLPIWACVDASGGLGTVTYDTTTGVFNPNHGTFAMKLGSDFTLGPWTAATSYVAMTYTLKASTEAPTGYLWKMFNSTGEAFYGLYHNAGTAELRTSDDNFGTHTVVASGAEITNLTRFTARCNIADGYIALVTDSADYLSGLVTLTGMDIEYIVFYNLFTDTHVSNIIVDNEDTSTRVPIRLSFLTAGTTAEFTGDIADLSDNDEGTSMLCAAATDIQLMNHAAISLSTGQTISCFGVTAKITPGSTVTNLRNITRIGSTNYTASLVDNFSAVGTIYCTFGGFATDPFNVSDWTSANVNSAETGFEGL